VNAYQIHLYEFFAYHTRFTLVVEYLLFWHKMIVSCEKMQKNTVKLLVSKNKLSCTRRLHLKVALFGSRQHEFSNFY